MGAGRRIRTMRATTDSELAMLKSRDVRVRPVFLALFWLQFYRELARCDALSFAVVDSALIAGAGSLRRVPRVGDAATKFQEGRPQIECKG